MKRASELVELARTRRGLVHLGPEELRVPDPMGRDQKAHRAAVMLITDAVCGVVEKIVPPRR